MGALNAIRRTILSAAVCLALAAAAAAYSSPDFPAFRMPQPTWAFKDAPLEATGSRSLKATDYANCIIKVNGTGKKFGIKSAYIKCTGRKPLFYAGKPWIDYAKKYPSKFIGVTMRLPNEANFLGTGNAEPCLFLVGAGALKITGYVRTLSLVDWGAIVIEQGTSAIFTKFEWSKNYGVRFPTLAVSRSTVSITASTWTGNVCTDKNRCHTGGLYVTEAATVSISKSTFRSNKGHLAGAMMVTTNSAAKVVSCSFISNSVVNYGDFGGAIFHDYCNTGRKSTFQSNKFISNRSEGFGGAMKIGSPDGGCHPSITSNTFQSNSAKLTGGAIFFTYCPTGKTPFLSNNVFASNNAGTFKGQIGYNPKTKPSAQGGGSTGRAGCAKPTNFKNKFSGSGIPAYCSPWYFP